MKKIVYLLFFSFLTVNLYGQAGWDPDTQLTYRQGAAWYPNAVCYGDTIHLVWYQIGGGFDGEVYYKRSTDAGLTWSDDTLLSI